MLSQKTVTLKTFQDTEIAYRRLRDDVVAIDTLVTSGATRLATNSTPASKTDTGTKGEIRWDANYVYICYDTDKWKRVAITDAGW
jgi:hypothetical protein